MSEARAKGRRIEKLAKAILEQQGAEVEIAQAQIVWIPEKRRVGDTGQPKIRPISQHHDFFGRFDLFAVFPDRAPMLVQTTTPGNKAARATKLRGFRPHGFAVELWVYHEGRGRNFMVFQPDDGFVIGVRTEIPRKAVEF